MNPVSEYGPRARKPRFGSRRMLLAVVAALVLIAATLAVALPLLSAPDYQAAAPSSWNEVCLGDPSAMQEVLDSPEPAPPKPRISGPEGSYASYVCELEWDPGSDGLTGQRLTLDIKVFDESEPLGYDGFLDPQSGSPDWDLEADSVEGFEHGVCVDHVRLPAPYAECMAADSNLELIVQIWPATTQGEYPSTEFGPGAVPIRDLTVAVGELVRSAFRA
ncbi:hypothetical protein [Glycomyces terrestris]|uniref:Uncharacterized protein n=1 Tax=Glycomyces terrestris TaxID=2493553 RepID=A0A426UXS8_9ACTN|nr:hypothetical protein [Glycomyces terrestris]RRR99373.1 hypothetical protein EIW28_11705 [Glycomyces terrestris]